MEKRKVDLYKPPKSGYRSHTTGYRVEVGVSLVNRLMVFLYVLKIMKTHYVSINLKAEYVGRIESAAARRN